MTKLRRATFSVPLDPTASASADGTWMRVLPAGTIVGGRTGRTYLVGGMSEMGAILAVTRKRAGSIDLAVDYDHQSVFGAIPGVGGRAPASGWMRELEARADGIWARITWTEAAAAAISASEYRYFSPTFLHDGEARVRALTGGALTNNPDLDLPVAMSAVGDDLDGASMDKIVKALGLPEGASEDQILAALSAALAGQATARKIADIVGGNSAKIVTGDELVTAVQSAVTAAPDPTKWAPMALVTDLQGKLSALSAATSADKVKAAVDKAVSDGKVAPALKGWATDFATKDLAAFSAFAAAAPKVVTAGSDGKTTGEPPKSDGVAALSASDLAVCTAMGLEPKAFLETLNKEAR